MNKSRNTPQPDRNTTPKRTITGFVRNVTKTPDKKIPSSGDLKNQEKIWQKKPNDSWDY